MTPVGPSARQAEVGERLPPEVRPDNRGDQLALRLEMRVHHADWHSALLREVANRERGDSMLRRYGACVVDKLLPCGPQHDSRPFDMACRYLRQGLLRSLVVRFAILLILGILPAYLGKHKR